jgi:hypothetical protein
MVELDQPLMPSSRARGDDRMETPFGYLSAQYFRSWGIANGWRTGNLIQPFDAIAEALQAANIVAALPEKKVAIDPGLGDIGDALIDAKLSQGIYDKNFTGTDGYTMVLGSLVDDQKTGLRTAVFSNGTHNVQVFSGTNPGSLANWWSNLKQAFGFSSGQYKLGTRTAQEQFAKYNGNLRFTGHSLGGGIASASAIITGGSANTFNPAAIHDNTLRGTNRSNGSIVSYYSTLDVLRIGNALAPASVPGNQVSLGVAGFHGIGGVIKALGRGRP